MFFIFFKYLFLLIFIQSVQSFVAENTSIPIVQILSGNEVAVKSTVLGSYLVNWHGVIFAAFRGIPYAKPPIGQLRFKDPQPLQQLPNLVDARYDGYECPSIYAKNASEDCLNLNIYAPLPISNSTSLPVIIFIHPGGLYIGSGASSFLDPAYLLTKLIIVVTFNYRLGTLGFLNLGTSAIPGNAGFKDQIFVLEWVHNYIAYFGGNPADVTLMGYSAGGLSVSLHLTSAMSAGLFNKAIIMSGTLPPQTQLPFGDQLSLVERQVKSLNCSIDHDHEHKQQSMLMCLNRFSGTKIAVTLRSLFFFGKDNPIYLWLPIVEKDFGQKRFLVADFYENLQKGHFHKVPIMIGFSDGEFCTSAADIINDRNLEKQFYNEYQIFWPEIFMYTNFSGNKTYLTNELKNHYLPQNAMSAKNFSRLCDLYSDALIRFGAHKFASLTSKFVHVSPYKFAYKGAFSNLNFETNEPKKVEHMDDLMYLFKMHANQIARNSTDAKIVQLYIDFIYEFVVNGKINLNGQMPKFPESYTLIKSELIYKNNTNFQEAKFWRQLFP